MALTRKSNNEIPEDAVALTADQAFMYQWKIIANWEKGSDTWALKHSPEILGACGAATGIYMNNYYRTKVRLGNYGKFSTYLPIVVLPAMTTALYHKFFVQKDIILEPFQCPTCLQLRAAAFQTTLGVIYPTLLSPLASFMFAIRHFTFRLPPVTEKPLEVLKLWQKLTKPIVPAIGVALTFHAVLAMYITFKETQQYLRIQQQLLNIEAKALAEQEENTF